MQAARRRVFREYRRRIVLPLVACVGVGTGLVCALSTAFGWLLGLVLWIAWVWLLCDRLILLGNGWVRRAARTKLRQLGQRVDHGADRFVGLAHPVHVRNWSRRILETDDDVGFLEVDAFGLHYRGDALDFDVPASSIESVALTHSLAAPWGRVEIAIRGGEPFDQLIFDSRNHASHTDCRRDNLRLLQQIRGLMLLHQPLGPRLTGRESTSQTASVSVG